MDIVTQFPRQVREDRKSVHHANVGRLPAGGANLAALADAAQEPVPAILEYLPYRKRDGTAERDHLTHPYFAGNGYALFASAFDMRGYG